MLDFARLDECRKEKGWSELQLCKRCNFGESRIRDWRNQRSKPKDADIALIAAMLDTTPEYLKGESDVKKRPVPVWNEQMDEELVRLWSSLSPEDAQRAKDFVQGLIAARKDDPSPKE